MLRSVSSRSSVLRGAAAAICAGALLLLDPGSAAAQVATPTPSTSASASATPSASASASPSATVTGAPSECQQPTTIQLAPATIAATGSARVTVSGTPGSAMQLLAYSRPSTSFRLVRQGTVPTGGSLSFDVTPPTNTRLYAQQVGCDPSDSVVLNVRTQLSLDVVRNGVRDYTFSGRGLPARGGGLVVSLYRVTDDGTQVLTAQARASAETGRYTIRRVFTGAGRFGFVVRTGQDLQNAPGSSNVRSLLVY